VTPENAKTQSWVAKTVWQRIPGRRARNSETPTTITVQSITRNDHLPLTGGPQLTTDDVGCLWATFHHVQHRCSMETSVHTPARRAWIIVLGRRHRTCGVRRAVAATSRYRTFECNQK